MQPLTDVTVFRAILQSFEQCKYVSRVDIGPVDPQVLPLLFQFNSNDLDLAYQSRNAIIPVDHIVAFKMKTAERKITNEEEFIDAMENSCVMNQYVVYIHLYPCYELPEFTKWRTYWFTSRNPSFYVNPIYDCRCLKKEQLSPKTFVGFQKDKLITWYGWSRLNRFDGDHAIAWRVFEFLFNTKMLNCGNYTTN